MNGKVIVITGALGALGAVVAATALGRGARVAGIDHAPSQMAATPNWIELGGVDLSDAAAGSVASATLFTAAAGGIGFGVLADQIGRKRALSLTLLIYSLGSAGTATVGLFTPSVLGVTITPFAQLIFWRAALAPACAWVVRPMWIGASTPVR